MEKTKVLLIDDDVEFANIIMLTLEELGYEAYYQSTLIAIKQAIEEIRPNAIILDVEIGLKNSIDVIPEIRSVSQNIPIIFISSHVDGYTIARALRTGGTAYLKKPFETIELMAYIDRHAYFGDNTNLEFGDYVLFVNEKKLYYKDKLIKELSLIEHNLLSILVKNKNNAVTRENICDYLWDSKNSTENVNESLTNFISRLRTIIIDNRVKLVTVHGVGYKLTVTN